MRMSRPLTHWVEHHTTITIHRFRRRLFEVELQKPRNLSASESEDRGHGEGVGVYATLLQSDTVQWSLKSRHESWGGWSPQKTKGPDWK